MIVLSERYQSLKRRKEKDKQLAKVDIEIRKIINIYNAFTIIHREIEEDSIVLKIIDDTVKNINYRLQQFYVNNIYEISIINRILKWCYKCIAKKIRLDSNKERNNFKVYDLDNTIPKFELRYYKNKLIKLYGILNDENKIQNYLIDANEQFKSKVQYNIQLQGIFNTDKQGVDPKKCFINCLKIYNMTHFNNKFDTEIKMIQNAIETSKLLKEYVDLIRYIVKEVINDDIEYAKEHFLIDFYCLEEFCGYRRANIDIDMTDELKDWFCGERKEIGRKQETFLENSFLKFGINSIKTNINKIPFASHMAQNSKNLHLPNILTIFNADGVSAREKQKQKVFVKNKEPKEVNKKTTKTLYFYNKDYGQVLEMYKNLDFRFIHKDNAKIEMKCERYKVRPICSTDLYSFVILTEIDYYIKKLTKNYFASYVGIGDIQKSSIQNLFCRSSYENVKEGEKRILLPLDYSHYDHSFSKKQLLYILKFILKTIKITIIHNRMCRLVELFSDYLDSLFIEYKDTKFKYGHGLLSGWKITNSYESVANYVMTYFILRNMGLADKDINYIITMGDDLVIDINKYNSISHDKEPKDYLQMISLEYNKLGIEVHPTKNSASYYFIEFLRITYGPFIARQYPARDISPLFLIKTNAKKLFHDQLEIVTAITNYCNRIMKTSQIVKITKIITSRFSYTYREDETESKNTKKNKEFINNIIGYMKNPSNYKVKSEKYLMSKLVEINQKGFYFNMTKQFLPSYLHNTYLQYLKEEVFSVYMNINKLERRKHNYKDNNRLYNIYKNIILKTIESYSLRTIVKTKYNFPISLIDYNFDFFLFSRQLDKYLHGEKKLSHKQVTEHIYEIMYNAITQKSDFYTRNTKLSCYIGFNYSNNIVAYIKEHDIQMDMLRLCFKTPRINLLNYTMTNSQIMKYLKDKYAAILMDVLLLRHNREIQGLSDIKLIQLAFSNSILNIMFKDCEFTTTHLGYTIETKYIDKYFDTAINM